ncbi:MAG: 3-oxoacyl-[acyl-carrier-protein] synthase [Abditibacteriota bacterium]|nr:3-oxoacyl-[acyl-carrier-protein] synthase [Abditibacteriota bacterium]
MIESPVPESELSLSPHAQVQTGDGSTLNVRAAGITGLGFYVPERVLTNDDLQRLGVDTNDEWIRSRTGIRERHIAADTETTADLAENAARRALEDAGLTPASIDLIIVATCTPDYQFPSTASLLQNRLGASCAAFDLGAACSGWVYGLVVAQQFVATGAAKTVLVVGAEAMSRILDWNDRSTAVLFGDGAGAAVVQAVQSGYGVLGFDLGSDGSGGELLKVVIDGEPASSGLVFPPADGHAAGAPPAEAPADQSTLDGASAGAVSTTPSLAPRRKIYQNGREVYRFAVNVMGESALRALTNCGVDPHNVNLFVPHQANVRIIDAAAKRLGLTSDRVFVNVDKYGNTSAASVAIALCEARDQGRIRAGDVIVTVGFGAGLTWASAVLRWGGQKSNAQ